MGGQEGPWGLPSVANTLTAEPALQPNLFFFFNLCVWVFSLHTCICTIYVLCFSWFMPLVPLPHIFLLLSIFYVTYLQIPLPQSFLLSNSGRPGCIAWCLVTTTRQYFLDQCQVCNKTEIGKYRLSPHLPYVCEASLTRNTLDLGIFGCNPRTCRT